MQISQTSFYGTFPSLVTGPLNSEKPSMTLIQTPRKCLTSSLLKARAVGIEECHAPQARRGEPSGKFPGHRVAVIHSNPDPVTVSAGSVLLEFDLRS